MLFARHCARQYGYRNEQDVSARLYGFSHKYNKNKIHKCFLVTWVELCWQLVKKKKKKNWVAFGKLIPHAST